MSESVYPTPRYVAIDATPEHSDAGICCMQTCSQTSPQPLQHPFLYIRAVPAAYCIHVLRSLEEPLRYCRVIFLPCNQDTYSRALFSHELEKPCQSIYSVAASASDSENGGTVLSIARGSMPYAFVHRGSVCPSRPISPVYIQYLLNEVRSNQRYADVNQVVCSMYRIPPSCTVRDSAPHQQIIVDQASAPHRTVPYLISHARTVPIYLSIACQPNQNQIDHGETHRFD